MPNPSCLPLWQEQARPPYCVWVGEGETSRDPCTLSWAHPALQAVVRRLPLCASLPSLSSCLLTDLKESLFESLFLRIKAKE